MRFVLLVFILLIPGVTKAAIIISEVAWMGSSASANHEWIELHNTGSSVDVTGWTLTDVMNLSISLSGTIGAGTYAVLERSSDASATGPAFLTYTGALVNTGATLKLSRSDGGTEDQIAGGTDWKNIGGDNVTKETAQYTSAGWVTGVGTPGSVNSGTAQTEEENEEEEETEENNEEATPTPKSTTRSSASGETVRLFVKDSTLAVAIDAQKLGYVNQDIILNAKPASIPRSLEGSLVYQWNFGDGTIGYGKELSHVYTYPGTYVATLYTSYKKQKQITRHEITILPVAMTLTKSQFGDIQVNNDSPYEIDISGYAVEGSKSFVFPDYSVLLPNQTITVPVHKVGSTHTWVKDTVGKIVTAGFSALTNTAQGAKQEERNVETISMPLTPQVVGGVAQAATSSAFGFATTSVQPPTEPLPVAVPEVLSSTATPIKTSTNSWPYVGLIVIMTLGLIGTALKVTRNQNN